MSDYKAMLVGVREEEIMELSLMATYMVEAHLGQYFGRRQKEYMVESTQSEEAIKKAVEDGDQYYWIDSIPAGDNESIMAMLDMCGYMSYGKEDDTMLIKNIYIMEEVQGRHLVRECVDLILREAEPEGINKVRIRIPEGNRKAIAIFEHLGFVNKGKVETEIGKGYKVSNVELER